MSEAALTPDRIRQLLSYDPTTGGISRVFGDHIRPAKPSRRKDGYLVIGLLRKTYYVHRVVWAYVYGEWPTGQIDHINCDKADNRIANLRISDCAGNARNKLRSKRNLSGVKGVHWNRTARKWHAQIKVDYQTIYLGLFASRDDAHAAYVEAAKKYHGQFARVA